MFDIGPTELLLIIIVAVLVIGPKDMPQAMRSAGKWIGKMRRLSGHFRTGLDAMVREAEMEEMEKKWADQNARIMRHNPSGTPAEMEPTGALPPPSPPPPANQPEAKPAEASAESAVAGGDGGDKPEAGKTADS